jgi:outer membrane protein assembly factor BamA
VTWSELSLFGTARSLSLDLRLSSLERRIQATYREPERLSLLGIPTWVSVYRSQDYYTGYDVLQRGMWIEFGDHFRRPFRTILRYEYLIVNPTAPPDILSQLEREQQRDEIASITPSIEWDTRDDIFSPHRGVYLSFSWQSAFKMLQADAAFNKVMASASAFAPAQGGVLAVTVRGGAIQPRTSVTGVPDNLEIPINERFFAGGRVSQRAFSTDLLGIPGQTLECQQSSNSSTPGCTLVATGGAGLLLASTEWRFPVYGPVGGDLFVDGGNVWQAWRDVNVGAMRWGAGLGLRVDTPIGPLRLEYGWKLDRKSFVAWDGTIVKEPPGELFLSFGNPF